nr:hypothetical protein [Tanacetum cinerariifolium]
MLNGFSFCGSMMSTNFLSYISLGANGHVSQLPNRHVSQLSNGHVSQLPNGYAAHLPNEHVSQLPRERLVEVLYREVSADMRKVDQYYRMSRLLEYLRLVNVEKAVRLRLMMKETEVKIAEKNISIRRLGRNGVVGTWCEQLILSLFVLAYNRWRRDLKTEGGGCVSNSMCLAVVFVLKHEVLALYFNMLVYVYVVRVSLNVGVSFCFKMPNVPNRFPLVLKDRLLIVFNEKVSGEVLIIREYRGISCGLRIGMQKREECIRELKALGDHEGVAKTVRFMKGLQADDMDRSNRTLSLMREVEVKAPKKSRFIFKLSGYESTWIIFLGMCRAFLLCDCIMETLPIYDELRRSVNSSNWEPQFILQCHREISDDVRVGIKINALCARLTVIVDERVNFVDELDMLAPEFIPVKMADLIKQIQDKDIRKLMKLQIVRREFELRAREKEIFIQKLKGNIDF